MKKCTTAHPSVAYVYQEDLETFLSLAEKLQLKGLTGGEGEKELKGKKTNDISEFFQHPPKISNLIENNFKQDLETEISNYGQNLQNQTTIMATDNLETKVSYTGGSSEDLK